MEATGIGETGWGDRQAGRYALPLHSGEWRNWQTRWLQVPVSVRTWGFKSPLAHSVVAGHRLRAGRDSARLLPDFYRCARNYLVGLGLGTCAGLGQDEQGGAGVLHPAEQLD